MTAKVNPLAGKAAPASLLVDVTKLTTAYFTNKPDPSIPAQRVSFGTSGHRCSAFAYAFNEAHILAIAQSISLYRRRAGIGAGALGLVFIVTSDRASRGSGWPVESSEHEN